MRGIFCCQYGSQLAKVFDPQGQCGVAVRDGIEIIALTQN